MPRSSFARHRHLILAVITALLLGLLASMALAATSHRSHGSGGSYGYSGYGYGGYGYGGYGYGGYGYGGYGYGQRGYCTPDFRCAQGIFEMSGQVYDHARYDAALAQGATRGAALAGAVVKGASVTLQRSLNGGPWITLPLADVSPAQPQISDDRGFFRFFALGTGRVRVIADAPGYLRGTSSPRVALDYGPPLNVGLIAVPQGGGTTTDGRQTTSTTTDTTNNGGAPGTTPTTPTVPTTPVTPGGPVRAAGCGALAGSAKAACERAVRLAAALRACTKTYKKGSRRTLCEKRARALSACDARTGRKRTACRAKALELGKKKTTKKAASKHAAHR